MADVSGTLRAWSGTAGSNNPTQATTIGSGLSDNLQTIQAVVRKFLASYGTNIASAATMDLTTMDAYVASVTGNTTVTGLGTEAAGVSYWLVFASTPMFKNGSNLLLGGSDITFAAGDIARFTAEGSGVSRMTGFYSASGMTGTGGLVRATSPTITTASLGSSTATTQTASDNSTKLATTAYVDRGAGSASVLIGAVQTASASQSIDFTSASYATAFDGTYDEIEFHLSGVTTTSDSVVFKGIVGTGAGPSYHTGGTDYEDTGDRIESSTGNNGFGAANRAYISLSGEGPVGNASTKLLNGVVRMYMPSNTAFHKSIYYDLSFVNDSGILTRVAGSGRYLATTAWTAFRFHFGTFGVNTIAAGKFACFGIRKA